MIEIKALFDLSHTQAADYLSAFRYPWEALDGIKQMILDLGEKLPVDEYEQRAEGVWVHKTAKVFLSAYLGAPNCVVGNSVELKNVILFDNVQVPHYNYVGDSILGYKSHMGAGSITSNVKSDKSLVVIRNEEERIETGRKKIGAILGDYVEVGCNSVLNPGTIIGRNSNVYPVSCVRGVVPENRIWKTGGVIVAKG